MHHRRYRRKRRSKVPILLIMLIAAIVMCGTSFSQDVSASEPETAVISDTYSIRPLSVKPEPTLQKQYQMLEVIEETPVPTKELEEPVVRYYDHIDFEYEMQELLWQACEETGCPYELALAVIFRESSYRNVNGDNGNSIGYMQVQPRWHQARMERLGVTDLSDPLSNFRVGCDLLSELIEKYSSYESALTCYNTGSPGTSGYANRVLSYMNETFPEAEGELCPEE